MPRITGATLVADLSLRRNCPEQNATYLDPYLLTPPTCQTGNPLLDIDYTWDSRGNPTALLIL